MLGRVAVKNLILKDDSEDGNKAYQCAAIVEGVVILPPLSGYYKIS